MNFNSDLLTQAQEIIFSIKLSKDSHPLLTFNNIIVYQPTSKKHLGIIFDNRLSLEEHLILLVLSKENKTKRLLHKLQRLIRRSELLTIYKTFVRSHLDYKGTGSVALNIKYSSLYHKMESVQYNTCLAIMAAIRSTSKEKLYYELGSESYAAFTNFRKLNFLSIFPNYY